MVKPFLSWLLAVAVVMGLAGPAGAQVKLSFWHGWAVEHERVAMEAAVKLFNDAHPDIKAEPIAGKTNEQILAAVSAGNPPDIASVWNTQTLAQWAATGAITDLDELVKGTRFDETAPSSRCRGRWS